MTFYWYLPIKLRLSVSCETVEPVSFHKSPVVELAHKSTKGFPQYGCEMSVEKTLINFDAQALGNLGDLHAIVRASGRLRLFEYSLLAFLILINMYSLPLVRTFVRPEDT